MLSKTTKVLVLWVSMTIAYSVCAEEDEGPSKIAVIDLQRAVLQTEKAQASLEKLKKEADFKSNIESLESLEDEYKKMVEKYQKDRAVMSAEKREDEERRILEKQQDIKYIGSKLQQSQKEWAEGVLQEFGAATQEVLSNIVQEQGIGLLLRRDARAVMHADQSYDISDQVTERLNAIK